MLEVLIHLVVAVVLHKQEYHPQVQIMDQMVEQEQQQVLPLHL